MHMRVAAGVGAWLLGVGAATAGSLLAVSLLGQGIATSTNQQLTESAVQRALAEATETPGTGPAPTGSPSPTPSAARPHQARLSQPVPGNQATSSARPSRSQAASSPSAQPTAAPSSTLLSSQGGTVVADCRPAGAYLLSWSPAPGYGIGTVIRGPAPIARVIFNSTANSVTMMVSCSAGVPATTNTIGSGSGGYGGDDGGRGGE